MRADCSRANVDVMDALLDVALPDWQFRERHDIRLTAQAGATLQAFEDLTWGEVPMFRALMGVRAAWRGDFATERRIVDMFLDGGFAVLARSADEIVVASCRAPRGFLEQRYPVPATPEAFADFHEHGHVKIGLNFRTVDGVLSTETRVTTTDRTTRRQFNAYWLVIRGFSGLIRREWLRAIHRRALAADASH
jgi:hypothetical protein